MSQRDDRYAGNDLPSSTGEFRAAQDISASTAEFRAFAAGQDTVAQPKAQGGSWPEQPWPGEAPTSQRSSRTPVLIIGAVVIVAIIIAVLVFA